MKWQILFFSGKIKTNVSKCCILKFLPNIYPIHLSGLIQQMTNWYLSQFYQKSGYDSSCKLSPLETICMKCQILFSWKNKKNISNCRLLMSHAMRKRILRTLTLVLLNPDILCFANSVDPDQLASEEANWSGSALFAIQNVNLYQQSVSRNLIGWKFVKGVAS